jgi:hypothetical protein
VITQILGFKTFNILMVFDRNTAPFLMNDVCENSIFVFFGYFVVFPVIGIFVWLESQLHDHGPLAWEQLLSGLAGTEEEALALRLMSGPTLATDSLTESEPELRDLINRMLIDRIKEQETQAIEDSKSDPAALQRYRELQARRLQLEKSQSDGIIQG